MVDQKRRSPATGLYMVMFMAYSMVMKEVNIAELKNNLSYYVSLVDGGEEIEIRRRNRPVARIIPVAPDTPNRTSIGCGIGTVVFGGADLTDPLIPESDWDMQS